MERNHIYKTLDLGGLGLQFYHCELGPTRTYRRTDRRRSLVRSLPKEGSMHWNQNLGDLWLVLNCFFFSLNETWIDFWDPTKISLSLLIPHLISFALFLMIRVKGMILDFSTYTEGSFFFSSTLKNLYWKEGWWTAAVFRSLFSFCIDLALFIFSLLRVGK